MDLANFTIERIVPVRNKGEMFFSVEGSMLVDKEGLNKIIKKANGGD